MSSWHVEIAKLRRELMEDVKQRILGSFGWTLTSSSSEMGDKDQVAKSDDSDGQRPARRLEQWGLRGRPVDKIRAFWIRIGSSNVIHVAIAPTKGYGPTDLDVGETALYSEKVERGVYLTKDGDNKLAAADGRTVQAGGDDYAMPTWDPYVSDEAAFVDAIAGITPLPTSLPQCAAALATIINAAVAFKAAREGASSYKSTRAKNG